MAFQYLTSAANEHPRVLFLSAKLTKKVNNIVHVQLSSDIIYYYIAINIKDKFMEDKKCNNSTTYNLLQYTAISKGVKMDNFQMKNCGIFYIFVIEAVLTRTVNVYFRAKIRKFYIPQ